MAKKFLKAIIEVNCLAFGSWLATDFWCVQLAKVRAKSNPWMLEDIHEGKCQHQRVNIFKTMHPTEIRRTDQPFEKFVEVLEETERQRGEPYKINN